MRFFKRKDLPSRPRTGPRLCLKSLSSARERAIFSPGKDGEAGDIGFIVDAVGCSQAENKPLEARSSFQTEPKNQGDWREET